MNFAIGIAFVVIYVWIFTVLVMKLASNLGVMDWGDSFMRWFRELDFVYQRSYRLAVQFNQYDCDRFLVQVDPLVMESNNYMLHKDLYPMVFYRRKTYLRHREHLEYLHPDAFIVTYQGDHRLARMVNSKMLVAVKRMVQI